MANARLVAVLRRRETLVARAEAQRASIAVITRRWRRPFAVFDIAIGLLRAISREPAVIALAAALFTRTRYARVAGWIGRAATIWQLYRAMSQVRTSTRRAAN